MSTFFEAAMLNTFTATLLGMLIFTLTRIWKNPHVAHALWVILLIKLLTPPLFNVPFPLFSSNSQPLRQKVPQTVALPQLEVSSQRSTAQRPSNPSPRLPASQSIDSTDSISATNRNSALARARNWGAIAAINWPAAAGGMIAAGSGLLLLIAIPRLIRFSRLLQGAMPPSQDLMGRVAKLSKLVGLSRVPAVMLIPSRLPPFVWSFSQTPTIVMSSELPVQLDTNELDTILLHELAHIRRRDYLVRWLELATITVYWWNPLVWLVRRMLRDAEEICCDSWVSRIAVGKKQDYARGLLRVAEFATGHSTIPSAATGLWRTGTLENRIVKVLSTDVAQPLSTLCFAIIITISAIALPVTAQPLGETENRDVATAPSEVSTSFAEKDNTIPVGSVRAICVMDRDGTNFEVVIREPEPGMIWNGSPRWSNDGKLIAFDSTTAEGNWRQSRIYVVAVSGPFKGEVVDMGPGVIPSWAPDDGQLAFQVNDGNAEGIKPGIWIVNTDGTQRKYLGEGSMPNWSPKGDLIACTDRFGPSRNVLLINAQTGERTPLFESRTNTNASKSRLAWAPDGNRLVYAPADASSKCLFFIVDVRDKKRSPVHFGVIPTGSEYPDNWGYPAWSPDGKQLVFQMFPGRGGNPTLYSMSAEVPSAPIRLSDPKVGTKHAYASWSPNSKRIVLSCLLPKETPAPEKK